MTIQVRCWQAYEPVEILMATKFFQLWLQTKPNVSFAPTLSQIFTNKGFIFFDCNLKSAQTFSPLFKERPNLSRFKQSDNLQIWTGKRFKQAQDQYWIKLWFNTFRSTGTLVPWGRTSNHFDMYLPVTSVPSYLAGKVALNIFFPVYNWITGRFRSLKDLLNV